VAAITISGTRKEYTAREREKSIGGSRVADEAQTVCSPWQSTAQDMGHGRTKYTLSARGDGSNSKSADGCDRATAPRGGLCEIEAFLLDPLSVTLDQYYPRSTTAFRASKAVAIDMICCVQTVTRQLEAQPATSTPTYMNTI
jgi:hypothetical protein